MKEGAGGDDRGERVCHSVSGGGGEGRVISLDMVYLGSSAISNPSGLYNDGSLAYSVNIIDI